MSQRKQAMESIGKFFRPAQGDAVTSIDLVGGDSQPFCDNPAQPLDGKEAVAATHQHPHRNVRPPLQGREFVHARFALAPPARQASMSASYRRETAPDLQTSGNSKST
jgi:hypothetical protein